MELDHGVDPEAVLGAAVGAGARVRHFEVADPSLEQIFIDFVGRPADEEVHLAPREPGDTTDAGPGRPTTATATTPTATTATATPRHGPAEVRE